MTDWLYLKDKGGYFRTYIENSLVEENTFRNVEPEENELPSFAQVRELLPHPVWDDNPDAIR